ncbi:hypothetical protein [Nitrosococcus watsonii]|uniref:Asparagine synthase n=1 Tax=Nitrosococcus watsoni (strain C-113) TaxID=105559 RepID=D8K6E4_NITWC|nr:hypothetical protein [Nitrosococcus watsonii]ADJ28471.1 conserved hypothetical protein [Nitrosococcus watsonii C-113]
MHQFYFHENPSLPPLAWCAKIVHAAAVVTVEHGAWVETGRGYFVEGAWKGDFGEICFNKTEVMLGSGGALLDGGVVFTPTTHTMERLYTLKLPDTLFVSNSLVYLLQATGSKLNMRNWAYESELMTFLRGYKRAVKQLRLMNGRIVKLHYHNSFIVDGKLAIKPISPPEPPGFESYQTYIDYLLETLAQLHRNANASNRRIKFADPITTISSGYDSPACAVLAKHIGCRQAVTFAEARTDFARSMASIDDSGEQIASYLDLEVEIFSRHDYLKQENYPEALFLATGNGGDDVVMNVLGSRLQRSLFFTGMLGDTLWNLHGQHPALSKEFRFRFPAGGSLQEFRLNRGFVHIPIPLLTFTCHAEIQKISASDEMRPWRIGGEYDRPIPRRLVEEYGVPRWAFAKEKRAITQPFWLQKVSANCMGAASVQDYHDFVKEVSKNYLLGTLQMQAVAYLRRLLYKYRKRLEQRRNSFFSPSYWSAAINDPLRFHWAVGKLSTTYRSSCFSQANKTGHQEQVATKLCRTVDS